MLCYNKYAGNSNKFRSLLLGYKILDSSHHLAIPIFKFISYCGMDCFQFCTFYLFFYGLLKSIASKIGIILLNNYLKSENTQSLIICFEIRLEGNQCRYI